MDSTYNLAKTWAIVAGVVLIVVGLVGFIPDQKLVGDEEDALLATDGVHNLVHILTGVVALAIYVGLGGVRLADALIAFGILYAAVFVLVLISPDLFGIMDTETNAPLHVIHALLAVVSLALGFLIRGQTADAPAMRPAR